MSPAHNNAGTGHTGRGQTTGGTGGRPGSRTGASETVSQIGPPRSRFLTRNPLRSQSGYLVICWAYTFRFVAELQWSQASLGSSRGFTHTSAGVKLRLFAPVRSPVAGNESLLQQRVRVHE
jgi:hypothetical protein